MFAAMTKSTVAGSQRAVMRRLFATQNPLDSMASTMKQKISTEIKDAAVNIDHGGDGYHWLVEVVSPAFQGLPKVKQHMMVSKALKDELQQIHAITIRTFLNETKK